MQYITHRIAVGASILFFPSTLFVLSCFILFNFYFVIDVGSIPGPFFLYLFIYLLSSCSFLIYSL